MRLLIFTIVMAVLMVICFFVGLFTGSTGLLILGFCPFVAFGNPLVWIACYKLFTEVYEVVPRGKSLAKVERRRAGDLSSNLGG